MTATNAQRQRAWRQRRPGTSLPSRRGAPPWKPNGTASRPTLTPPSPNANDSPPWPANTRPLRATAGHAGHAVPTSGSRTTRTAPGQDWRGRHRPTEREQQDAERHDDADSPYGIHSAASPALATADHQERAQEPWRTCGGGVETHCGVYSRDVPAAGRSPRHRPRRTRTAHINGLPSPSRRSRRQPLPRMRHRAGSDRWPGAGGGRQAGPAVWLAEPSQG
jgi:hypothetical protein